jgi:hypothetical protein
MKFDTGVSTQAITTEKICIPKHPIELWKHYLFLLNCVCGLKGAIAFVFVIIGKESPTIVSLNVPETFEAELPQQCSFLTLQPSCSNEGSSDTTCESSTRVPCK